MMAPGLRPVKGAQEGLGLHAFGVSDFSRRVSLPKSSGSDAGAHGSNAARMCPNLL